MLAFKKGARLAGPLLVATACLALVDRILLLVRESRMDASGAAWVTFLDAFIIIGIAWIPCYLLLRLVSPRLRVPAHALASLVAVWWILDHTPSHAIGPMAGPDTSPITVAFCVIAFAALNWAMALRPLAATIIGLRPMETARLWIVTGAIMVVACASLAWALVNP